MADRLQVPQSFVSKYESGERLLTFLETMAILRELGVSMDELLDHLPSEGK
jgi:transcriptional regulator with XRE-family HTH domain